MSRTPSRPWLVLLIVSLAMPAWMVGQSSGAGATAGAPWPAVNESSGCGQLRTYPPLATRTGRLPRTEAVGGPYGAMFGRTIGEVEDSQVWWTVPMSNGQTIRVHRRALPAFERVSANLAAAAASGKWYPISVVRGQSSRTVAGKYSMSYHAFGAAVDINPAGNPYRSDNTLITNMPGWFVDAWRDAGFCWGGDWLEYKDTMHFSWKGPLPTPGYPALPDPYPVRSQAASFTEPVALATPPFGPLDEFHRYLVGNATGRGAPDVVQLTQHELGVMINIAGAGRDYAGCAVERSFALGGRLDGHDFLLGDFDGTARNHLWEIDPSAATLVVVIHAIDSETPDSRTLTTGIASGPDDFYLAGDGDGDGRDDLYVVRRGTVTSLEVWSAASNFGAPVVSVQLPVTGDTRLWRFALGDRDVDGEPDLYALDLSGPNAVVSVFTRSDGYSVNSEPFNAAPSGSVGGVSAIIDNDGDGRDDLVVLDPNGTLRSLLGNVPVATDPARWYRDPAWECEEDALPFEYSGTFRDDDLSVFQPDIEWLAAAGITKGCNWPFGDHFCPDQSVSRAEMATFLVRALGLQPVSEQRFLDVAADTHAANINAVAAAGITLGCVPDGSRYCPEQPVTRTEMATFLVRALGLQPVSEQRFLDVAADPHAANINAVAAAGITLGCVPDGSLFCPQDPVSRSQMAAFLQRALGSG